MELAPDLALIAGLIGEPARAAILAALASGRSLPAGELAFIGNVAPQTASFHLRKLMDAALIAVEKQGRHNYYRLADDRVAAALESIAALAPLRADQRAKTRHESERARDLRLARTCYRHLAGALAVQIHDALLHRGFLQYHAARACALTDRGSDWSRDAGIDLARAAGKSCLDWTERRPHIGGPLGVALFSSMVELRWMAKIPGSRSVRITHSGVRALEHHFGIPLRP